jgi:hypothetical protein
MSDDKISLYNLKEGDIVYADELFGLDGYVFHARFSDSKELASVTESGFENSTTILIYSYTDESLLDVKIHKKITIEDTFSSDNLEKRIESICDKIAIELFCKH